ncbi:hypothetical protein BH23BAC3_BH23BAC3_36240 [soil metagenome]
MIISFTNSPPSDRDCEKHAAIHQFNQNMSDKKSSHHTYSFEKLEVWKLARELRNVIYELSARFPDDEKYGVVSQIRKSVNSITDNLAEGSGRASNNDRAHFTNIAYTSALETINQLITCLDQKYLTREEYESLRKSMDELINKLNAYYRHQLNKGRSVKDRFR